MLHDSPRRYPRVTYRHTLRFGAILSLTVALAACETTGNTGKGTKSASAETPAVRVESGVKIAETPAARVESGVRIQDVSYDVKWRGDTVTVTGELRIPAQAKGKIPAVLVLHSRGGIDGTGAYHVKSFNKAGFATLEIDMFTPRGYNNGKGLRTSDTLPDTFGGLNFLSKHPAIDPTKIAITGYSWGGILAMKSMMKRNIEKFGKAGQKFAAHVAYYPVCYLMMKEYVGDKFNASIGTAPWTDDPLLILVGEKDDYEGSDTCKRFVAGLPEKKQRQTTVHIYPGAGHGFDVPSDRERTFTTRYACFKKGCEVKINRNDKAAADSLKREISFIRKAFGIAGN